ncbi:MAG: response regulator transcription factor [Opitutaceae bacterium]
MLLVDDHMIVRMGLAFAIGNQPDMEVVAQAVDGVEACELYRAHHPDVVVLDLRMPKQNGIETIAALKLDSKDVRVLVLSSFANGNEIATALAAGACGFLGKEASYDVLMDAIRRVAVGDQVVPDEAARRLATRLSSQLSARELAVLTLLGRGMRNKEIGAALDLVESTVKVHLTSIFSKLGVGDRTQAVLVAMKRGLIQLE